MAMATVANAKTVTVNICDGEMHGEGPRCRTVTYKVRPMGQGPSVVEKCMTTGEAAGPCATAYGVPEWLKALNKYFTDRGLGTPDQEKEAEQYQKAGG